jgi:hypothetical protein
MLWDVTPCTPLEVLGRFEAVYFSKTSVTYHTIRRYIPEDTTLDILIIITTKQKAYYN